MSRTDTDCVLQEKQFGVYSLVFNDSDGEVTLVNGRPLYRHDTTYLFFSGSAWLVGSDFTKRRGCWMARSGAITPELIREPWLALGDDGVWTAVDGVGLITREEYGVRVHQQAQALGDVALHIAASEETMHVAAAASHSCLTQRSWSSGGKVIPLQ